MLALIAGVLLWWAAHLFKRLAPGTRAGMGDRGKGLVALALGVSVILMIVGYRRADVIALYAPLAGMGHLNNLAMLVAVFLFGVGGTKGTLYTRMRHPMLWGTVIWAGSHLLVNGDLASVILFGGIGAWALVAMAAINRAEPWEPPVAGRGIRGDAMNLVGTLVVYGLIAGIHFWLGYNPFLGTYG
ncbi:MAG: NnrU family protein [Rhodobacter sp.]|nr:NnrU family protein [Rhodobacter sp.]